MENGEWSVLETSVGRMIRTYTCCSHPHAHVVFEIRLRRRPLFFIYNIVLPCIMLSLITIFQVRITPFLGYDILYGCWCFIVKFRLPSDSGEKIVYGLTLLLTYSVFSLNIGEKLPETSDVVPLIGILCKKDTI